MTFLILDILESFLGPNRGHNEETGQTKFDCPACSADKGLVDGDGKGNLEVNYNIGMFKCWACQETNHMHGPIGKLLRKYGSAKNVRDYFLIKPEINDDYKKEHKHVEVELPEGFKRFSDCNGAEYRYEEALRYLHSRGITDDIIKKYDIGFTVTGKYHDRIIIPSYDSTNTLNYFVARWFPKQRNKLKYINPDAEKQEIIFNEGRVNLDATIYIVEGPTDHIVTPNSIPLLGKYLSPKLIEFLHDNAMSYIVIFLDGDAIGDAKRLYFELNFGNLRGRVKLVECNEDYDPSKIHEKFGKKGIVEILKTARFLSEREL